MGNIKICDICKKNKIIKEVRTFLTVRNHPELRIDICDKHNNEIMKKYPSVDYKYVKFIMEIKNDIKITDEWAKNILKK